MKTLKPLEHAQNNVDKYGGKVEDYIKIHEVMDSSKQGLGNKLHRAVYHHTHFIYNILPLIFGSVITNSDGKKVSTTQVGEDHLLEDMGNKFLPTISDWLANLPMEGWMDNGQGGYPPSYKSVENVIEPTKVDLPIDGASIFRKMIEDKHKSININIDDVPRDSDLPVFFTSVQSD